MATNLRFSDLGGATGEGSSNISLSGAAGSSSSPVSVSSFTVDSVGQISGFTYTVENTSEEFELLFSGANSNFNRISSRSQNFSWGVSPAGGNSTNYFTISSGPNRIATLNAQDMNPQSPDDQTELLTVRQHTLSVVFSDGFNVDATGYNTSRTKTIYSVDSYSGNATELCLTTDTLVTMADGSQKEAGDIEVGDMVRSYWPDTMPLGDDPTDYMSWNTLKLTGDYHESEVVSVLYSFVSKVYDINHGQIYATLEHPFLVHDVEEHIYRYKRTFDIKVGDKIISDEYDENKIGEIDVTSIEEIELEEEIVSIDVEEVDTYFANGFLTHNKGGDSHSDIDPPPAVNSIWSAGISTGGTEQKGLIKWASISNATAYDVELNTDLGTFVETEWNSTEFDVLNNSISESITLQNTNTVRVRAIRDGLRGGWSDPVEVVDIYPNVLSLDAGIDDSYPGSGTTWTNVALNATLNGASASGDPDGSGTFPIYQSNDFGRFYFDGSKGLNISDNLGNYGNTGAHEVWFYRNDISTSTQYIADARNGSGNWWLTNYQDYNINIHSQLRANDPVTFSGASNWWQRWIHIVITGNGSGSQLYINGSQITGSNLISSSPVTMDLGSNFRIANRFTGSGRLDGYIASYNIYDYQLSSSQVQNLFEAKRGRFNI